MRISVVVPDISSNAMARTCPIAETLTEDHSVEIVGFDSGNGFFEPYAGEFEHVSLPVGRTPISLAKNVQKLQQRLTGDVCYAFRPLVGSIGVSLLHKRRTGTPIILDIEDILRFRNYPIYQKCYNVVRYSGDPTSDFLAPALDRILRNIDHVTVTSSYLAQRYNGTVLPYGPPEDQFDPSEVEPHPYLVSKHREHRIIVFIGTIRPHKGLDVLADALKYTAEDVRLVIAGYDPHGLVSELQNRSEGKVDFVGPIPHSSVPAYLKVADLVVIPQKRTPYTRAQIPNKVFEAMAMGKPIIASATSDLPEILEGCGEIVEPSDPHALADRINDIFENEFLSARLGKLARCRYLEEYSREVLRTRLNEILESVKYQHENLHPG